MGLLNEAPFMIKVLAAAAVMSLSLFSVTGAGAFPSAGGSNGLNSPAASGIVQVGGRGHSRGMRGGRGGGRYATRGRRGGRGHGGGYGGGGYGYGGGFCTWVGPVWVCP